MQCLWFSNILLPANHLECSTWKHSQLSHSFYVSLPIFAGVSWRESPLHLYLRLYKMMSNLTSLCLQPPTTLLSRPQNPDIVLVHYLNVPAIEDCGKPCGPILCSINTDKKEWAKWTKEELIGQLKPMCKYLAHHHVLALHSQHLFTSLLILTAAVSSKKALIGLTCLHAWRN